MEQMIVYLDDAGHALQQLVPMRTGTGRTRWILVACAPRMTQRIGKWVSHSARENWRRKWSEKLFDQVVPELRSRGDEVIALVAKGPLAELTARLHAEHGPARVLDARRPKFGHELQPVVADQPANGDNRWSVPGAVAAMGAVLVLAGE